MCVHFVVPTDLPNNAMVILKTDFELIIMSIRDRTDRSLRFQISVPKY